MRGEMQKRGENVRLSFLALTSLLIVIGSLTFAPGASALQMELRLTQQSILTAIVAIS